MKIAIDIDDTLTIIDRVTTVKKYIEEQGLPFKLVNPDSHTLSGLFDWTYDDVTAYIRGGGAELFTRAPLRAGAKETVQKLKAAGHEIIILTARSKEWFTDPVEKSRIQLDNGGIVYDEIVACVWEKGEYCVARGIGILIEDNFEICKKAQDLGVNAVMFVDRHNRGHAEEIKYACSDWAQVALAVERIAEKG